MSKTPLLEEIEQKMALNQAEIDELAELIKRQDLHQALLNAGAFGGIGVGLVLSWCSSRDILFAAASIPPLLLALGNISFAQRLIRELPDR